MKVNGQCHCGFITYEAEIDPDSVFLCHCSDCQTLSGTAFRSVAPCPDDKFELLSGEPKIYTKISESGNPRPQAFCPECGTSIYATSAGDGPKTINLRAGTIRQRSELPPKAHYWYRSAQGWISDLAELRRIEKQ